MLLFFIVVCLHKLVYLKIKFLVTLLNVRLSQNEFMKSSISKKLPKKFEGSMPREILQYILRAEILQIFRVIFWKIDDFINPF